MSSVTKLNYSVKEAAEALGLSSWMVRKLIADGTIPAHRYGDRVLIPARELEAANEQHATEAREKQRTEERTWRAS